MGGRPLGEKTTVSDTGNAERGGGGSALKGSKAQGEARGPGRGPLVLASKPLLGCCKTTRAFPAWVPDLVQNPWSGVQCKDPTQRWTLPQLRDLGI